MAIRQIKNGAKICDGHRTGQGQRFPRHQTQGAGEAVSAEGRATQARQIRSRDGARNRRLRALREALPRVVEGLQGQKMSKVRKEAFGSSRPRKEKARRNASGSSSAKESGQRYAVKKSSGMSLTHLTF